MKTSFSQAYISDRAGVSIADYLADECPLSKSRIKQVMAIGGVWRKAKDGEPQRIYRQSEKICLQDEIHVYYDEAILKLPQARLTLIADHQQFSVWSKSPDFLLESYLYCDHLSFTRAIERDVPHERNVCSILPEDPSVSGLCLFSHTPLWASKLLAAVQGEAILAHWRGRCLINDEAALKQVIPDVSFTSAGNNLTFSLSGPLNDADDIVSKLLLATRPDESRPFLHCAGLILPKSLTGEVIHLGSFKKNADK